MPVTDLTDSLPWWAQQGAGVMPGGGVMNYQGSTPGSPQGASWLQYLSQMFGVSPAEAAEPMVRPGPSGGPPVQPPQPPQAKPMSPDWPFRQGYPDSSSFSSFPSGAPQQPPAPVPPPPPGPTAMPARPASGMGLPPGSLNPTILGSYNNMPTPSGGGGGAALAALPAANPNAPATNAQPVAATPGPLAAGGAGGMGATSNPRFVPIDRPNAPAGGSPYGRGGGAQMSALNLAGLFGGGPQGGPRGAPAGGGPVRGPMSLGPATTPGGPLMPFDITGYPVAGVNAPSGGQLNPAVARARMLQPNYYS